MPTLCPENRVAPARFLNNHVPTYYCTPVCEPSLTGGTPRSVIKIPYLKKEKSIRIYALYTGIPFNSQELFTLITAYCSKKFHFHTKF